MKRTNTVKIPKNIAVESSDDEESVDEEQESQNEQEIEESNHPDNDEEDADQESGLDLAASATDSDEDEEDDGNESDLEEDIKKDIKPTKNKAERIRDALLEKYQERQGKQLYIRFPHKIAETEEALEKEVKELTPLIVKVHKPRQKHARFCLVDFATNENRDIAFKQLKKTFSKGDFSKYVVNIPKTESQELVSDLAERKIKSIENKKAKNRLRKASKKALTLNNFTSTVIVFNLPKTASVVQIRELFPNAVDIQVKPCKGKLYKDKSIAAINLPSTMDARNAIKKKLSLGGNQLMIKFDNQKMGRNKKPLSKDDIKADEVKTEESTIEDSEPSSKKAKLEAIADIFNDSQHGIKSKLDFKNKQSAKNPFNKANKAFNKGSKPFNKGSKPFNKGSKPFNKGSKPLNNGKKPFNKDNKDKNNFKNKPTVAK